MNITLKNLLPNGDFDSGWSSNTEFPTCTVDFSGDQHLYGTKSAKVTSTITNTDPDSYCVVKSSESIFLVKGHKYYSRCSIYLPDSVVCSKFDGFSLGPSNVNKWTTISSIATIPEYEDWNFSMTLTGLKSPNYVYLDGAMFIDLSKCCGTGSEPSKETMDSVPFFVGEYESEPLPSYSPTYGIYLKVNGTWTCVREYNEST